MSCVQSVRWDYRLRGQSNELGHLLEVRLPSVSDALAARELDEGLAAARANNCQPKVVDLGQVIECRRGIVHLCVRTPPRQMHKRLHATSPGDLCTDAGIL